MDNIIDFNWCEKHGMERPGMNVSTDSSMCLLDDEERNYLVVYTERTTGEKELFVKNPDNNKSITFTTPKYDFKRNVKYDFITADIEMMCDMVGLFYPFETDY